MSATTANAATTVPAAIESSHSQKLSIAKKTNTPPCGALLVTPSAAVLHTDSRYVDSARAAASDGPIAVDGARVLGAPSQGHSMVELTLHSGRNRIVRRMLDAVGHPVDRLARTRIGPVRLGVLPVGEVRELTREELGSLLDLVGM